MYRTENKYPCSKQEMLELAAKLKVVMKPDSFSGGGSGSQKGSYKVTSVYFDDYRDTCFRNCIDGIQPRKKYRIRIYNNSFYTVKLEIKEKKNGKIQKSSQKISYEEMLGFLSGKPLKNCSFLNDAAMQFYYAVKSMLLKPKIVIAYDRTAFCCRNGNVRITLDRNIKYHTSLRDFMDGEEGSYRFLPKENGILEIKYDSILPGYIAEIVESGNRNQISYSKYRLCREAEGGSRRCLSRI